MRPVNTGDVIKERFEVKESLGEGGYGAVYHVWDAQLKEDLALKACDLDSEVALHYPGKMFCGTPQRKLEMRFDGYYFRLDRKYFPFKVELERPTDNEPGLEIEIGIIKKLQFSKYVTRYKDEGRVGPLRYVIMQLVGKNLADLRTRCPRAHFSPNTTANLALQCLEAISDVHSVGIYKSTNCDLHEMTIELI
uniref:Protein kinase domain-containing protein n=1 Tax=Romanomermis culicivorax TaxID=13658 RepID=A0A915ILK2_ROMCU